MINIKNICNLTLEYDIVLLAYENEEENTLKKELREGDIAVVMGAGDIWRVFDHLDFE